jgi:N-sulfoglucosamine sulfohydrolase
MSNRLIIVLLSLGSIFAAAANAFSVTRPNILLLVAEDMSSRVGAFGDAVAVTPNLDRLAQDGIRYSNVFTTAGVCSPSRVALITGVPQISLGAQHMRTSSFTESQYLAVPPVYIKAFPELLRREGYYTYTDKKLDYQFSGTGSSSGPFTIWNDEGFRTHWRNREEGSPFFGMVNFMVTHESGLFSRWRWPKDMSHLGLQLFHAYLQAGHDDVVTPDDVVVPPYYPDTPIVRKDIARHYNNIHIMDKQVGDILGQLAEDNLLESTIVIWTADHGDGLPRAKREVFDSGIKVPMIIRWPEKYRPSDVKEGGIDNRLISFIDLAPTILNLAGVDIPSHLEGSIFAGENKQSEPKYIYASKDRMIEVNDRQRAVRDKHFKYIRNYNPQEPAGKHLGFRDMQDIMQELWRLHGEGSLVGVQKIWFQPRAREELYDVNADSHEINNLATNPAYHVELERMRNALESWLTQVQDLGEIPEKEMADKFWPRGTQPVTKTPFVHYNTELAKLELKASAAHDSIGFRVNGGKWQLYEAPVHVNSGDRFEIKSVRYGWKESDVKKWSLED